MSESPTSLKVLMPTEGIFFERVGDSGDVRISVKDARMTFEYQRVIPQEGWEEVIAFVSLQGMSEVKVEKAKRFHEHTQVGWEESEEPSSPEGKGEGP